jgi:cytochrome b561
MRLLPDGSQPGPMQDMPAWTRVFFAVAVAVMWLPFLAAPIVGYLLLGWAGAVVPLLLYALCCAWCVALRRSPRLREASQPPEIDTSDPRWRNLMP